MCEESCVPAVVDSRTAALHFSRLYLEVMLEKYKDLQKSITCCHFFIIEVTEVEGYPQGGVSLLLVIAKIESRVARFLGKK